MSYGVQAAEGIPPAAYQVYSHIMRHGFSVRRFPPTWSHGSGALADAHAAWADTCRTHKLSPANSFRVTRPPGGCARINPSKQQHTMPTHQHILQHRTPPSWMLCSRTFRNLPKLSSAQWRLRRMSQWKLTCTTPVPTYLKTFL